MKRQHISSLCNVNSFLKDLICEVRERGSSWDRMWRGGGAWWEGGVYIQTSIHTSEGGPLQMLLTLTLNFLPVCPKNLAARPTTVYKCFVHIDISSADYLGGPLEGGNLFGTLKQCT
jgi:hypothetical protein